VFSRGVRGHIGDGVFVEVVWGLGHAPQVHPNAARDRERESYGKRWFVDLKRGVLKRAPCCKAYTVPLRCVTNVGWVGFRPPTSVSWQLAWNTLMLSCTLELSWLSRAPMLQWCGSLGPGDLRVFALDLVEELEHG
jgi:hypothetical protein